MAKINSRDLRVAADDGVVGSDLLKWIDVNDLIVGQSKMPRNRVGHPNRTSRPPPLASPTSARRTSEHQLREIIHTSRPRCSHDTHPPHRRSARPPTELCPLHRQLHVFRPRHPRAKPRSGHWRLFRMLHQSGHTAD